jgi:hypothetical protein
MRKIQGFFAGIFLLAAMTGQAQFKKGDRMAGASVASALFNSGNTDVTFPQVRGYESKSTQYSVRLEPSFAWFISEKTAVGASVNINPAGQKATYKDQGTTFQEDKTTSFNIGIGGFLRNYFGNNTSSFMPFGQVGVNAGISSGSSEGFKYYDDVIDYKLSYEGESSGGFFANALLQFGLTKMVGESTGLDIYIGYNYSYNKNTFKTTTKRDNAPYDGIAEQTITNEPTSKFTNHGVIVGVGFQIFLRGKK